MIVTETGDTTGTADKDYNLFRRAQGESQKGAEQAKKLLAGRLNA